MTTFDDDYQFTRAISDGFSTTLDVGIANALKLTFYKAKNVLPDMPLIESVAQKPTEGISGNDAPPYIDDCLEDDAASGYRQCKRRRPRSTFSSKKLRLKL